MCHFCCVSRLECGATRVVLTDWNVLNVEQVGMCGMC